MTKLLDLPEDVEAKKLTHGFFEDFQYIVTADLFTVTASNSGTAPVADGAGGLLTINPSDGTVADNDETYVHNTWETFLIAANKPLQFGARVQFTEGSTDDVNVMVGVKDAWAANSILDDGGGPAASYSGACFFKVDGGTLWNVEFSLAGTQNTVELNATNSLDGTAHTAGGAAYQVLEICIIPRTSALCDVMFYIDGTLVYKMTDQTYTSATAMEAGMGIKNGADTTVEALVVDYVYCYQTR